MNISYESILKYLSSKITKVSTLVGSFANVILSACTFKFLDLEGKVYALKQNMDIDTADSNGLDILASNKGLVRKSATKGVAKGLFNIEIPEDARFQIGEIVWVRGDFIDYEDEKYCYRMVSEQVGAAVNKGIGKLTPITFIEGLTYAYTTEMLIMAEDEESDDELRERIKTTNEIKSFGGNCSSYKEFIKKIDGVGAVKVIPTWNGGGTVKCIVLTSEYTKPSEELIDTIQELVDPDKEGQGQGMAPIGAVVTIDAVNETQITISADYTFESGTFEDWKELIFNQIKYYMQDLCKEWEHKVLVVRISDIIARLINTENIIDVTNLKINGSESNLQIINNEIPVLIEVKENE